MSNPYYKDSSIKEEKYYSIPDFVNQDFSDIKGKELLIQEGDRLDIIAEQIYGDATYWKAILIYNNIGYFFDVKPGVTIKLPYDIQEVMDRL